MSGSIYRGPEEAGLQIPGEIEGDRETEMEERGGCGTQPLPSVQLHPFSGCHITTL